MLTSAPIGINSDTKTSMYSICPISNDKPLLKFLINTGTVDLQVQNKSLRDNVEFWPKKILKMLYLVLYMPRGWPDSLLSNDIFDDPLFLSVFLPVCLSRSRQYLVGMQGLNYNLTFQYFTKIFLCLTLGSRK